MLYIVALPGGAVYCGETEALSGRLKQHKRRFPDALEVAVLPMTAGGKSEAKRCEAAAIAAMQRAGVRVDGGGSDGSHRNFDRGSTAAAAAADAADDDDDE